MEASLAGMTTINDGKELVDYDGVFDLPEQVKDMLHEFGYSTSQVEVFE